MQVSQINPSFGGAIFTTRAAVLAAGYKGVQDAARGASANGTLRDVADPFRPVWFKFPLGKKNELVKRLQGSGFSFVHLESIN